VVTYSIYHIGFLLGSQNIIREEKKYNRVSDQVEANEIRWTGESALHLNRKRGGGWRVKKNESPCESAFFVKGGKQTGGGVTAHKASQTEDYVLYTMCLDW